MKRIFLLSVIIINLFYITSCWNYKEIDKLAIVAGMAVDKAQNGEGYLITAEIVDLQPGTKEIKIDSKRVEAEGKTIFDAIRNMIKISAKKLYWSHSKAFIISEEIARDSILPVLDWINRDQEPRLSMDVLISKEKTAHELLTQKSITTVIRTFEMKYMLETNDILSKSLKVPTYELINSLAGEGISSVVPTVAITINDGFPTSELSGVGIFKKDKLIGFLDEEDTKTLLFLQDKIKGGLYPLKSIPDSPKYNITLEIFENKTKLKPVISDNKLIMNIKTKTVVTIAEHDLPVNYIEEEGRIKLKNVSEKELEENIKNLIKYVQANYGVDIFGFGKIVKADMPSYWKTIPYNNWNEIFKNLEVEVQSEFEIRGSGLSYKPIEVGD